MTNKCVCVGGMHVKSLSVRTMHDTIMHSKTSYQRPIDTIIRSKTLYQRLIDNIYPVTMVSVGYHCGVSVIYHV